jgi:hypothetical protein
MDIVFTLRDFGAALHMGADVESRSYIVNLPDKDIPEPIKKILNNPEIGKHTTVSLSILDFSERLK